jgi:hypothetical protein
MNAPIGFEKQIFIHSSEKTNRDSILRNGLRISKNPVIIQGVIHFQKSGDTMKIVLIKITIIMKLN